MNLLNLFIALIICITIHEASHAWVAYILGDPTAKIEGRVSLNPIRHLDPLGTIMIFIAHFGWGKPVPFNYNNLKNPRRDSALIAMAGPFSNLLLAFLLAIVLKYIHLPVMLYNLITVIYSLNLVLFLFNLLPIAPLDGSKLLGLFIPLSKEDWYQRFLSQGPVYLILFIIADRLFSEIIGFSFISLYLQSTYELLTAWINIAL